MNTALIFVCSDNVDAYINAAAHLHDKRGVTKFTFVFLVDAITESPPTNFIDSILSKLSELAVGKYNGRTLDVSENERLQYALLAATLRSNPYSQEVTTLDDLPKLLRQQASAAKPGRLFIDVTGLTKNLLVHVFSIAIFYNHEVHSFELQKRPSRNHPELSLYFRLRHEDFRYQPLTQEPTVQRIRKNLIPISRIWRITTTSLFIGALCLVAFLILDQDHPAFVIIGTIANVLGIGGSVFQFLTTKSSLR